MKDELMKYAAGATAIGMVVLVGYLVYKLATRPPDFEAVPLPDVDNGASVRTLTMKLHSDMDGVTLSRDLDAWRELLEASNETFVAVYNDFGNLYYEGSGATLRGWIESETFAFNSSIFTPWSIYVGSDLKAAILARMDELNLQ